MTMNKSGLFWGVLLIGAGALVLAQQTDYMQQLTELVWVWAFALISLLGILSYALSGWKQWGWLFPAGVFGGLAITTGMALSNMDGAVVAAPLFFGLLIPFAAAYLTDRTRNWWALIPGGVMLFLVFTLLLADSAEGEWIGALFLFMTALAFLIVYLNKRTRGWALLVAYSSAVLGLAPVMASGGPLGQYYGAVFLLAVAVPFFAVYFRSKADWWALIPAGVMTLLSIVTFAAVVGWIGSGDQGGTVSALLAGGLAAVFAVIWLRHGRAWAKVVAIVLAALAVSSFLFAAHAEILWPVIIILVGLYLVFVSGQTKDA